MFDKGSRQRNHTDSQNYPYPTSNRRTTWLVVDPLDDKDQEHWQNRDGAPLEERRYGEKEIEVHRRFGSEHA